MYMSTSLFRLQRFALILLLLCGNFSLMQAQRFLITGTAQEEKTNAAVEFASVALLRPDSTGISAVTTDENGKFTIKAREAGKYLVKLSFVGFTPVVKAVELTAENDSVGLGTIVMKSSDNILKGATVSAVAAKVEQKDDTTMFNASAYRVPEGSTLESLVKQLPGVEVDDDGTIKWNGKTVTEFLINGKDFFKGDTQTAMKNLPTDLVNKIKAYDKKSDYAEQTGIDDGEETTVLDITTKRELNESWITNVDLAYGNKDRYSGRIFATRFTDRTRVTVFGAANNTNDQGFGGPRGFGRGQGGLTATKNAGLDFSWESKKTKKENGHIEVGGNVRYNHSDNDLISSSNSETFLTSGSTSSFSNSRNFSSSARTNVYSAFRLQWNPDTMTTITFRPSYTYSKSRNNGNNSSATFSDDPYTKTTGDPLEEIFRENVIQNNPELYALLVNTNERQSLGESESHSLSGTLNIVRKLNSKGRNVSLRARAGWGKSESESFSISSINFNESTGKPSSFLNQYSNTPGKNWNLSTRLGYVEPLGKNWYGELRYQYSYKYTDSNRSRYNLNELASDAFRQEHADLFAEDPELEGELAGFGSTNSYPIGTLPTRNDLLNYVRDQNNSQYATYKYFEHTATAGVRYNSEKIRFNAGVDFNPEKTKMRYNRPGQHIDTLITRDVFMVSPQVRFRYKFSKTTNLDINYRGSASQPSMTDLLAVVDDSDPLNISMGNPGLKPSWNNNLFVRYNGYDPTRQRTIMAGMHATQTINSVSNNMVYDPATGVRYVRPENINGNWNARAMFMFNSALGAKKLFNINNFLAFRYDNSVGYISTKTASATPTPNPVNMILKEAAVSGPENEEGSYNYYNRLFNAASAASEKNTTRTLGFDENLNLTYRATWFDVSLLGRLNYQHARATIQENANMDTWNFAYGASTNVNLPWGMSISTDIRMTSRRGYSDQSMNTNELVWNAQIAQSFLKKKAATISIQFYDILHRQSNVSRTLTATQRTDTWSNAINSYFMVHFIYKLNIFNGSAGNKSGEKEGVRMGPPNMQGPGGMPARPMGPPMGGGMGGGRYF